MSEPISDTKHFVDRPMQERFRLVIEKGKEFFKNSALIDPSKKIKRDDLDRIAEFHKAISPANPYHPWRLQKEERPIEKDPSFFSNWESPGGPLEHIKLAGKAAEIIAETLKTHIKHFDEEDTRAEIVKQILEVDPLHVAAAASLHDEGREFTHIFYTTDVIGSGLLARIGIREDVRAILPDEKVMWTPLNEDMNEVILGLNPEAVLVLIADDYGKRLSGTNRLTQRSDFTQENQEIWAASYVGKPASGRTSDRVIRGKMPLHTANEQRYLDALDNWVRTFTDFSVDELTRILNRELAPTLPLLSEKAPLSSDDIVDGEVIERKIELDGKGVKIKAVTRKGGPNKKFNEDGCSLIVDGSSLQIFVVDGGTQLEQVKSLGDISGGDHIKRQVVSFSKKLNPSSSVSENLKTLNQLIRNENNESHSDIIYAPDSKNIPYGSIAGVKVDTNKKQIEISNAGDVFVVIVKTDGESQLVSVDDVRKFDQLSFAKAQELARQYGLSVREVIQTLGKDERFKSLLDQELVTMEGGNTGKIPRITGFENFRTHDRQIPLDGIHSVMIFSDGAIPAGIDIHTQEGLADFVRLTEEVKAEGLPQKIKEIADEDPDFEKSPRFRDIDDMIFLQITL